MPPTVQWGCVGHRAAPASGRVWGLSTINHSNVRTLVKTRRMLAVQGVMGPDSSSRVCAPHVSLH